MGCPCNRCAAGPHGHHASCPFVTRAQHDSRLSFACYCHPSLDLNKRISYVCSAYREDHLRGPHPICRSYTDFLLFLSNLPATCTDLNQTSEASHQNTDSLSCLNVHGHCFDDPFTNTDPYPYVNQYSDRYANIHAHSNADPNADTNSNIHVYLNCYRDIDSVSDPYKYIHIHIHSNLYANDNKHGNANFYPHRYIYTYTNRNADFECDGKCYSNIHTHSDGDRYAHSNRHGYTFPH